MSDCKLVNADKSGNSPVKIFPTRLNDLSLCNIFNSPGRLPYNLFPCMDKNSNCCNRPRIAGIRPEIPVKSKFNDIKLETPAIDTGMSPTIFSFRSKYKYRNKDILCIDGLIVPVKLFELNPTYSIGHFDKSSNGIVPSNVLLARIKVRNSVSLPTSVDIPPDIPFSSRLMNMSFEARYSSVGIDPSKLLCDRSSWRRLLSFPIVDGIFPTSPSSYFNTKFSSKGRCPISTGSDPLIPCCSNEPDKKPNE